MKDLAWIGPGVLEASRQKVTTEILLATHNSVAFLEPLLQSLLDQTEPDFHLLISDDCSRDGTLSIIERYAGKFAHPVRVVRRDVPSGSAMANFAGLLQASTGDHVFLCDHDDVWAPDKVRLMLAEARAREARAGSGRPLFLFSDAEVIDAEGQVINPSFFQFKRADLVHGLGLPRLLMSSPMIGCTVMMNRALVELVADVPVHQVTGHDWWALLVASAMGDVGMMRQQLVRYRIHAGNSSRPKEVSLASAPPVRRAASEVQRRMTIRYRQAQALLDRFGDRLPQPARSTVEDFVGLPRLSAPRRKLRIFSRGYVYPDLMRKIALLLFG